MYSPPYRAIGWVLAAASAGCRESAAPARPTPAALVVTANLPASASVGALSGTLTVLVSDARGSPVPGALVTFTVSLGAGRVSPAADTTRADGTASTAFTIGTTPEQNQVTAVVSGVPSVKSTVVTGVVGPSATLTFAPRTMRFTATQDSNFLSATPRDGFANGTGAPVTWASRDPALLTVTPGAGISALVRVVSRPGQAYVVASSGAARDSILVSVHDASSTPCTFLATPTSLSIGASALFEGLGVCLKSTDASAEYALVAHYNTAVSTGSAAVNVVGTGVSAPTSLFLAGAPEHQPHAAAAEERDHAFEHALRLREQREMDAYVPSARAWIAAEGAARASAARSAALAATARVGDLVDLNVNAFDFCTKPNIHTARIVAITSSAVVLADTSNPPGGFSEAEFQSIGAAMDTLVSPVDTTAFGAPSDIDGNGRVAILFTRAVNELTPRGTTGGVALGFFYSRDLLPRLSQFGSCPSSNTSEMFYVLVPDPNGVAADPRTKTFVQNVAISTIAHEYQHLINASRRMYVNAAPRVNEEIWLNEGLSHIAEELVFYRASKLSPRQNLGASQLTSGTDARTMFETYQRSNFGRYLQFLRTADVSSPLASNDLIATRGATWAFLRYLADRAGPADGDFWRRIVNSQLTGTPNVDAVLAGTGLTTLSALRDWAVAVVTDDNAPGSAPAHQQPSWNFVTALPETGFTNTALLTSTLGNGIPMGVPVRAGASTYIRFAVAQGQEAFIQALGPGGAPRPPGVHLTVLRIR